MTQENLTEREFELINIIGAELAPTQRDLSRQMDMSLGMVNMLVRRLISKGYIRIRQLNKRKVEYILTPQGFAEKMRKSVKYTLKTINSISTIKNCLREVLSPVVHKGEKEFYILGHSDFALLVDNVLKELSPDGLKIDYINQVPVQGSTGVVLICKELDEAEAPVQFRNSINLVEELAKDYTTALMVPLVS